MLNFKPIEDTQYEIDQHGNIRYIISGKKVKSKNNRKGYPCVTIKINGRFKTVSIVRLIAKLFMPDFTEELFIKYKDGNRQNYKLENLYLSTTRRDRLYPVVKQEYISGGNNDEWRQIRDTCYEINKAGEVRNTTTGRILKISYANSKNPKHWPEVTLMVERAVRKNFHVGQLVAAAFHPDYYEGCRVYYKDSNNKNFHLDNLLIGTRPPKKSTTFADIAGREGFNEFLTKYLQKYIIQNDDKRTLYLIPKE